MSRAAKLRQLLLWCLPALLAGLVLRILLATAMPYAYVQHDSIRLLVAGASWLPPDDVDVMSNNVPFLVPALFKAAQHGPIPALITIELLQHVLGLVQIFLVGFLVRCWFERWKWWIIPATLIAAIHPSYLWFEHTVMLETIYVFATVCVAVAGTWLLRHPSLPAAAALCGATFFVAITRPEGKLFVAFATVGVVVAFWREWKRLAGALGMAGGTAAVIALTVVPGESGLLLYSSVIHLTPEVSGRYPEAAPYVAPFRVEAIEAATKGPAFVSRAQREALSERLTKFIADHPGAGHGSTPAERMNCVAKAMAIEACLRAPGALLPLSIAKFRATADEVASGKFTESWLQDRQIDRLRNSLHYLGPAVEPLYGRRFADLSEAAAFVKVEYPAQKVAWFCSLHDGWSSLYSRRLPSTRYPAGSLPGLPKFYFLPVLGMIAVVVRTNPARSFHACWLPMLAGLWFVVMLSANERPRFRMVFEPFLFLYPFAALDAGAALAARRWRRGHKGGGAATVPS